MRYIVTLIANTIKKSRAMGVNTIQRPSAIASTGVARYKAKCRCNHNRLLFVHCLSIYATPLAGSLRPLSYNNSYQFPFRSYQAVRSHVIALFITHTSDPESLLHTHQISHSITISNANRSSHTTSSVATASPFTAVRLDSICTPHSPARNPTKPSHLQYPPRTSPKPPVTRIIEPQHHHTMPLPFSSTLYNLLSPLPTPSSTQSPSHLPLTYQHVFPQQHIPLLPRGPHSPQHTRALYALRSRRPPSYSATV